MKLFHAREPAVAVRGMHLDLKGLPPTPRRLLELLDLLAAARFNCVLVEWEDTYPWRRYPELRCATAYSRATVEQFFSRAARLGIEVVPLVQSFGHLENVLGRRRFRSLRELPDSVGEICPCHPGAQGLIRELVDDVLETHAGRISHFHLGGDEVWTLGRCPKCRAAVAKDGKAKLYLHHVAPLLEHLRRRGLRPMLWDDMMRHWSAPELLRLAPWADLMPWTYGPQPFEWLKPETLRRFRQAGITMWGAGAFKGADGLHADVCQLANRIANMRAWSRAAGRYGLRGVVATGWSRYSTYRIPCEGLEASLDSLVLAGAAMWDGALPGDAQAQADRFLRAGKCKALAGARFVRCRETSRDLQEWWNRLAGVLSHIRGAAHLAGEGERFDPRSQKDLRNSWRKHLAQGAARVRAWQRAHAGRVPPMWIRRYGASRLWLPRALDTGLGRKLAR